MEHHCMPIWKTGASKQSGIRLTTALVSLLVLTALAGRLDASKHSKSENAVSTSVNAPEADVVEALQQVVSDEIIHGTQQYAKENTLYGAHAVQSSSAFDNRQEPGNFFYKVAQHVLAPRNFNESSAIGTITVRYIVQPISETLTNIRIDAVYIEDDRRTLHRSEGVVESAEFAEFERRLEKLQANRNEDQKDAGKLAQLQAEDRALSRASETQATETPAADATVQHLQDRVRTLRREVERRVKAPGTELKSAPFRSASTIVSLAAQTDVVVMVITPYWFGVETADGHRGWIHRTQVESLP
jgi:hypothetical protein